MKKLGLYIHIPFCLSKCYYCDFYSVPVSTGVPDEYLAAVSRQIDEYGLQTSEYVVDTIFLGGGTPSLMNEKQISSLLKHVYRRFNVSKQAEITMEANPGTVDKSKLKVARKAGVNRLSLGAQSFCSKDLSACGRVHSVNDNLRAVSDARAQGYKNINLDIMYGLPGQTMAEVIQSLGTAFKLGVEHISFYGLKIEEGTPFYNMRDTLDLPNEDSESEMYFVSRELMLQNGYYQYEISNFAKKDMFCRHNIKYWNGDEYLGIGPAAHSYFAGKRFSFKKDIKLYIDSFSDSPCQESIIDEMIDIPQSARVAEYVMLRMRLSDGIDCAKFFKLFGRDFDNIYYEKLKPYINSGHVLRTSKGYAFSPQGMYVSNYILSRVIDFDMNIPGI
jgi:oxygen-independent coproporphyrinogen-3 oxidase